MDGGNVLAQITPVKRPMVVQRHLSFREKAAVITRFLIEEGVAPPLTKLPEPIQAALAEQMGQMRTVDRQTLAQVVEEYLAELEEIGLSFSGGIEGALSVMDGHISANAANRLRRLAGTSPKSDPWERLIAMPAQQLLPALEDESIEVAAVVLSKLPVQKSAELLGMLPGDRARRVAFAVSMTSNIAPETVRRIGQSLAAELDQAPIKAFDTGPVERVGAILNIATAQTRDDVLLGLDEADLGFATKVRRAIFTFEHLPKRLSGRDVPKVARAVDQALLVTALAGAQGKPELEAAAEHLLSNMSQRLSQGLREDMTARGKVKEKEAEDAMSAVIMAIRTLETDGELILLQEEEES